MARYKRNQVEDAIVRTLDAKAARVRELQLRLKRLLAADRRRIRRRGADTATGHRYAFYSQAPPGSGVEVMFAGHEAFALLVALLLLEHGFPQGAAVRIMRQIRIDLDAAHRQTLKKDPKTLFDPKAVMAMAKPGMIATDNTSPIFLAIIRFSEPALGGGKVRALVSVCNGNEELAALVKQHSAPGYGTTFFELASKIHSLATNLAQTRPIKRGRSTL
jgi:hypothetical protein